MTLLTAAKNALVELIDQHTIHGTCEDPEHCPAAIAIRDLRAAIMDAEGPDPKADHAMTANPAASDTAHALLRAGLKH